MIPDRWFDLPAAFERLHKKPIKVPTIVLNDGEYEGRKGEIWVYTRQDTSKVAVTLVFENRTMEGGRQFKCNLTQQQAEQIEPCVDGEGFEIRSELIPVKALKDEFEGN